MQWLGTWAPSGSLNLWDLKIGMRAGVIPYTFFGGQCYVLLGRKRAEGTLTDFGGGCKKIEKTLACAIREMAEESEGLLTTFSEDLATHIVVTGRKQPHQAVMFVRMDGLEPGLPRLFAARVQKRSELSGIAFYPYSEFLRLDRGQISESLASIRPYLPVTLGPQP